MHSSTKLAKSKWWLRMLWVRRNNSSKDRSVELGTDMPRCSGAT
jgi:hypothetical protein